MTPWEAILWLIVQAQKGEYRHIHPPFKDDERVGNLSHYRFFWLPSWWEALFNEEWREQQHKALDYANDHGPNPVILFVYEQKRQYDAKKKNQEESNESNGVGGRE